MVMSGEEMRRRRREAGITQGEMGEWVGVTRQTVWEEERREKVSRRMEVGVVGIGGEEWSRWVAGREWRVKAERRAMRRGMRVKST